MTQQVAAQSSSRSFAWLVSALLELLCMLACYHAYISGRKAKGDSCIFRLLFRLHSIILRAPDESLHHGLYEQQRRLSDAGFATTY